MVYIDDNNGGSGLNEVLIIDGQQRITTMYILLKALYDASKDVSVRVESEIEEVMFNRHCEEKYKVKLKPVKTDNEQLTLLIKDKIDKMDRNSNVYKNYESTQKRYRAKPINYAGKDVYVSTQFFDSDRDSVIEWYKNHLS